MKPVKILPAYGVWSVSTEGDVEGRTTRQLGAHKGYLDEVAFALADQAYYGLRFSVAKPIDLKEKKRTEVQVSLDIDTGTWDMNQHERVHYFANMLQGRPVTVVDGQYYACVKLLSGRSAAEHQEEVRKMRKAEALAKLTVEDRKVLGLA